LISNCVIKLILCCTFLIANPAVYKHDYRPLRDRYFPLGFQGFGCPRWCPLWHCLMKRGRCWKAGLARYCSWILRLRSRYFHQELWVVLTYSSNFSMEFSPLWQLGFWDQIQQCFDVLGGRNSRPPYQNYMSGQKIHHHSLNWSDFSIDTDSTQHTSVFLLDPLCLNFLLWFHCQYIFDASGSFSNRSAPICSTAHRKIISNDCRWNTWYSLIVRYSPLWAGAQRPWSHQMGWLGSCTSPAWAGRSNQAWHHYTICLFSASERRWFVASKDWQMAAYPSVAGKTLRHGMKFCACRNTSW